MPKTVQKPYEGKYFDEQKIYYNMKERNNLVVPPEDNGGGAATVNIPVNEKELDLLIGHYKNLAAQATEGVLDETQIVELKHYLDKRQYMEAINELDKARKQAHLCRLHEQVKELQELTEKLIALEQAAKSGGLNEIVNKYIEKGENFDEG